MAEFDDLSQKYNLAPNFAPNPNAIQVEPAGGGATITAQQLGSLNPELNAMMQQYMGGTDYSGQLATARKERLAQQQAFNQSLEKLTTDQDQGPSKAEMYFRLAAALGKPTRFGTFGESMGPVAEELGSYQADVRKQQTANKQAKLQVALKQRELALEEAKDTEKTMLTLQSEANKDRREFIKATVKEYIDSGKPASEAGRIAKDMGFKVGTPEYQEEVDKQAKMLIEKQMGAINAQLLSGKVQLADLSLKQAKESREQLKLEPDERKAIRDDEDAMFAAKSTIKNMNTALSFVDQAFTNTAADQAQYKKLKQTNPSDPRVKATEELENLIGQNVVGSLKTTFGGNPTEGERRALQELGGLGSANKEVRKAIIKRAMKALAEAADYRSARITKIETGGYRKKTEEK